MNMNPEYIHVYYGSSFDPKQKWVTKNLEYTLFSPSRTEAIEKALDIQETFLFPPKIHVHPFNQPREEFYILRSHA